MLHVNVIHSTSYFEFFKKIPLSLLAAKTVVRIESY